jgi:ATP-dependent RNA helicase RhlE
MLDMGFLPDIRRVLRHLPRHRQTLFFSATIPPPIVALTREMLRDPATINMERRALPAAGITQAVYPVAAHLKTDLLLELLKRGEIRDALVFTRTKHRADRLARALAQQGIKVERIHGNRSQSQRTEALAGFKSGKYLVLVATDIAARGIDVTALGHVVNFDVPPVAEDYIHRVGRTARAELTGSAFTLVSPEEEERVREIERGIGRRLSRVTVAGFDYQKRPVLDGRDGGRGGRPAPGGSGRPAHAPGGSGRPAQPQGGSGRPAQAPGGRPFRSFSRNAPVRRRPR